MTPLISSRPESGLVKQVVISAIDKNASASTSQS